MFGLGESCTLIRGMLIGVKGCLARLIRGVFVEASIPAEPLVPEFGGGQTGEVQGSLTRASGALGSESGLPD